jgi:hypothetical protein
MHRHLIERLTKSLRPDHRRIQGRFTEANGSGGGDAQTE